MPKKPALRKSLALPGEALRFPHADVTATLVASGRTVCLAVIPPRFSVRQALSSGGTPPNNCRQSGRLVTALRAAKAAHADAQ